MVVIPANRKVMREKMACIVRASSVNMPTPIAPMPVMASGIVKSLVLYAFWMK